MFNANMTQVLGPSAIERGLLYFLGSDNGAVGTSGQRGSGFPYRALDFPGNETQSEGVFEWLRSEEGQSLYRLLRDQNCGAS